MIVFLNGKFVPEKRATVSIFDRGFLYGDGLFEAMLVVRGKPFRWPEHLKRLQRGAEFLKIKLPFTPRQIERFASELIKRNKMPECILRITLSRGVGLRGYSPKGADKPTLVMSLHAVPPKSAQPPQWRIVTSSYRVPAGDKLAQIKNCNKLPHVLARAEADAAGANEALLLNTDGHVVEGTSSNLFWISNNVVHTPPLGSGILPGITRLTVLEICRRLGVRTKQENITPAQLCRANGVFLSLTSLGIVGVVSLDGHKLKRHPLIDKIRAAYHVLIEVSD